MLQAKRILLYKTKLFSKNILILLLCLLCCLCFINIISNQNRINVLTKEMQALSNIKSINLNEAQAYKLLYENQKYSNDKILDTIYWSLGGISVAIFALFGANVFYNFRINKTEINNLRQTMHLKTIEFQNKLIKGIDLQINDYINKASATSSDEIRNTFSKYSKEVSEQISSIDSNLTETNKSLEKIAKNYDGKLSNINMILLAQNNNLTKKIEHETNRLLYQLYDTKAQVYMLKNMLSGALDYFIKSTLIQIELDYNIEMDLFDIIELMKTMKSLSSVNPTNLNELIAKAPEKYHSQIEVIKGLYKGLAIK